MPPSDDQRAMMRLVLENFSETGKATLRDDILRKYSQVDELDQIVFRGNVFKVNQVGNTQEYLPTVWVYHLAGDPDKEAFARKSVQTLVKILLAQFFAKQHDLSRTTLLAEAKRIDPDANESSIELGINLCCEMYLLQCSGGTPQQPEREPIKAFDQILRFKDAPDKCWDELVSNFWPDNRPQATEEPDFSERPGEHLAAELAANGLPSEGLIPWPHSPSRPYSWRTYYWEFLKRFGKECYHSWRVEFYIALAVNVLNYFLTMRDKGAWEGMVKFAEANLILYALFVSYHFIRTPYLMHHEHGRPDLGGMARVEDKFGVFGCVILAGIIGAIGYGVVKISFYQSPTITVVVKAPPPPTITTTEVHTAKHHSENRDVAMAPQGPSSPKATAGPAAAANSNVEVAPTFAARQDPPRSPPQISAPLQPATFLDRVVQENRSLTPDDRNRLSTELYECDQFVKQTQALGYKLNVEFGKLGNDRQSGALAKNVDDHIKILRDLDKSAWDQYHGLQQLQGKWQYFSDQTQYVFTDNPYNAGVGLVLNAIEGMTNALTSWSKIANRDQQDILNIEAQQQGDYERDLRQFFTWVNVTLQRITQMRQSLDPNGVVQPLPANVAAPAPSPAAML